MKVFRNIVPADRARQNGFRYLQSRSHFPVVIVGAGINGLGTFHDLCHQGVNCLLVDRNDFCSGTSSALSRLIHGGIKYLETGEFRLVEESVRERNRLLKNAPHLVHPLEVIIPIETFLGGECISVQRFFGNTQKLKKRGRMIVKAGLFTYDLYSHKNRVAPQHRMISGWDLHASLPGINDLFKYAASYFDATVPMAERLGVELALDGMNVNPKSLALNYCSLQSLSNGKLILKDKLTGTLLSITTDALVNAAGPWIDDTNSALGKATHLISGSKGSHLLLDLPALYEYLNNRMIYFDPGDGRICLILPIAGKVMLGSSDIPVTCADHIACDDDEIDYMFDALRRVFPHLKVSRKHIVFTYSGVRPLPASDATDPGTISRDHSIHISEAEQGRPFPIFSLVGGKWTTYRAFGAQTCDLLLKHLGRNRVKHTVHLPIGGGRGLSRKVETWEALIADLADMLNGNRKRAWTLASRYGSRAKSVISYCGQDDQMLPGLENTSMGEIRFLVEVEMCEHVSDIVLRRLPLALKGMITRDVAETIVEAMASVTGWNPDEQKDQVFSLAETMLTKHRIDITTGTFR